MSFTLAAQHTVGFRLAIPVQRAVKRGDRATSSVVARASSSSSSSSSSDTDIVAMPPTTATSSRRSAVLFAGLSAASSSLFAAADPAKAERGTVVCDPTAEGAECRARELGKDDNELGDYEAKSAKKVELAKTQTNPDLTNYQKETLALADEVQEVLALDIYDLTREKRIAALKKDGNTWCSKYAPGGSAKTASGRAFYNAVNQLIGHYNANGIAPLPASRQEVVVSNVTKTRELIAEGR